MQVEWLSVNLGDWSVEHVERWPLLRWLQDNIAPMREGDPSAAQCAEIILPVFREFIGSRGVDRNPAHILDPKTEPNSGNTSRRLQEIRAAAAGQTRGQREFLANGRPQ